MVANIPYNPNKTSVAAGAFVTSSKGLVQGDVYPDPAIIYKKASGTLAQSETVAMYGGVAIYTDVGGGAGAPASELGTIVGRSTSLANLIAFSTWSYGQVNSPQSPVPLAASGMQVEYYRLGSGARVVVKCDPNLVALRGELTTTDVSWDFENQMLVPYASTTVSSGTYTADATVSSGTYNAVTGEVSLVIAGNHGLEAGDPFALSAMTGTGANLADLDGTQVAIAGTAGTTLNFTLPTGLDIDSITGGTLGTGAVSLTTSAAHGLLPGDTFELSSMTGTNAATLLDGEWTAAAGTAGTTLRLLLASGLTLTISGGTVATGGILPVQVLDVQSANCMTVVVDPSTGDATWDFDGCAAVILI
jgi:hypothetical protein